MVFLLPPDRFASLLSTSVPMNLAVLYNRNSSPLQVKGHTQRRASLDMLPETKGEAEENLEDDDEDDYETMNPGVSANDLVSWTEMRGGIESREQCIPRPFNVKTGADVRPVRYASVALSQRPNDSSSSLSSPSTPTITTANGERSQGQDRTGSMNNFRVSPRRWTRSMLEEDPTKQSTAKQLITTSPKWAKPQNNESKMNSTQLNSNWPRMYAKTGMYSICSADSCPIIYKCVYYRIYLCSQVPWSTLTAPT